MAKELWRTISINSKYQISNLGRVRNSLKMNILRPSENQSGYQTVMLGSKGPTPFVHHLVLTAFEQPRPKGKETNHKNGNPSDNRFSNLEWVTRRENSIHRSRVLGSNIGESHGRSKIKEIDVIQMRKRWSLGESCKSISKSFSMSHSCVNLIVRGIAWPHVPVIKRIRPFRRRVTDSDILQIRKLYKSARTTHKSLGLKFGIDASTVCDILSNKFKRYEVMSSRKS